MRVVKSYDDIVHNLKIDVVLRQRFAIEFLGVYSKKFGMQPKLGKFNPNSDFWIKGENYSDTLKQQYTKFLAVKYCVAFEAEVVRCNLNSLDSTTNLHYASRVVNLVALNDIISTDSREISELRNKYMAPGTFSQGEDVNELPLDLDTKKKIQGMVRDSFTHQRHAQLTIINNVVEILEEFYERKLQQLKLTKLTEMNLLDGPLHEENFEKFLETILEYPVTLLKETKLFIKNFVQIEFAKVAAELEVEKLQAENKEMSFAALTPVVEQFLEKNNPEAQKIIEVAVRTAITLKKQEAAERAIELARAQFNVMKKIENKQATTEEEQNILEKSLEDVVYSVLGRSDLDAAFDIEISDIVVKIVMEASLAAMQDELVTTDPLLQSVQDEMGRLNFSDILESMMINFNSSHLFLLEELNWLINVLRMEAMLRCSDVVISAYQKKEGRTVTDKELGPHLNHPETTKIANIKIAKGIAFHQAKILLSMSDEEQKQHATLLFDSVGSVLGANTDAKVLAKIMSDAVIDASIALMNPKYTVTERIIQINLNYANYITPSFVPDSEVRREMPRIISLLKGKFGVTAVKEAVDEAMQKKRVDPVVCAAPLKSTTLDYGIGEGRRSAPQATDESGQLEDGSGTELTETATTLLAPTTKKPTSIFQTLNALFGRNSGKKRSGTDNGYEGDCQLKEKSRRVNYDATKK